MEVSCEVHKIIEITVYDTASFFFLLQVEQLKVLMRCQ